jgi:hypothetical protein
MYISLFMFWNNNYFAECSIGFFWFNQCEAIGSRFVYCICKVIYHSYFCFSYYKSMFANG